MNIVYQGIFLKDGLKQLGHNIIEVPFTSRTPFMETLDSVAAPIDLVVLELFGAIFHLPASLADSPYPMVAYAIDGP